MRTQLRVHACACMHGVVRPELAGPRSRPVLFHALSFRRCIAAMSATATLGQRSIRGLSHDSASTRRPHASVAQASRFYARRTSGGDRHHRYARRAPPPRGSSRTGGRAAVSAKTTSSRSDWRSSASRAAKQFYPPAWADAAAGYPVIELGIPAPASGSIQHGPGVFLLPYIEESRSWAMLITSK